MRMKPSHRLLLASCAFMCSTQACAGREYSADGDTEALARRTYFYVGGQYVKTTLVWLLHVFGAMANSRLTIRPSRPATQRRRT
jgi:drug/metabolite transporter superfamily protein YnfA